MGAAEPAAPATPFYRTAWFRRSVLIALGLLAPALCPLLPWPRAQRVCLVLADVAANVSNTAADGGM